MKDLKYGFIKRIDIIWYKDLNKSIAMHESSQ